MTIIPPYLKKGDTIGIVCPSGYMPHEKATTCISVLQQWGYQVRVGKTLGSQFHYFSGTDEERLHDLQMMLDDSSVKAILFGRGGYGLSRIIDQVDFKKFRTHPKWLIGFSDITLLHSHVFTRFEIATLHSPMAAAFNGGGHKEAYVLSLRHALQGKKATYSCLPHALNQSGKAEGLLVGGNLSLLAHLIGTKSCFNTSGKILFMEDVGEYLYHVDRMLIQLKRAGILDKLAGLIVGGFTDLKDTTTPFGADVYTIISHHVKEYNYPVCFDFPVSHGTNNYALKIGTSYSLRVAQTKTIVKEIG